ncbi:MAG: YpsA SLOG family protein [Nitrospirales bacterium]
MIIVEEIRSGGQTGADLGGLLAAKDLGLKTGGFIPKGFLTELGLQPELAAFGLQETSSKEYPPRTRLNIQHSDGTVIFTQLPFSRGSRLTFTECVKMGKPKLIVNPFTYESPKEFLRWLEDEKIKILNVAGSRESRWPGIEESVRQFIRLSLLGKIKKMV